MHANPPLTGVNWASMLELSLRSLSWLWALHFFSRSTDSARENATVRRGPSICFLGSIGS